MRVQATLPLHVAGPGGSAAEMQMADYTGGPISIELTISADAPPGEYYPSYVVLAPSTKAVMYDYRPTLRLGADPQDLLGELYALVYPNGIPAVGYRSPAPTDLPVPVITVR